MFNHRAEETLAQSQDRKILIHDTFVNFFGLESKGMKQTRGNGILILTEKELHFELYLPKQVLSIPLTHITNITTPRSHLSKSKFKPLLKIYFTTETGQNDSIAWLVKDLSLWHQHLIQIINKGGKNI